MAKVPMWFLLLMTRLAFIRGFSLGEGFSRTKRQTSFICVPTGTCITPAPPPTIDPRIVAPGEPTPTPTPAPCPSGQIPCYLTATAVACGQRYVSNVATADGAATAGAFPWQAYIRNATAYVGSGVLLDSNFVLTAAHKVSGDVSTPINIKVNIGVSNPQTTLATSQERRAATIVLHESYSPTTLKNDIALIRLSAPISLGYQLNVGSACMPTAGLSYIGQRCLVSGWGKSAFTSNDAPTNPQKQVTVPIVNYTVCRASMAQASLLGAYVDNYLDPAGEICAGGEAGKDACTYDGGAPMVCLVNNRYYVAGLVSWGKSCGQANVYGVYVNVANYTTWVSSTITRLTAAAG